MRLMDVIDDAKEKIEKHFEDKLHKNFKHVQCRYAWGNFIFDVYDYKQYCIIHGYAVSITSRSSISVVTYEYDKDGKNSQEIKKWFDLNKNPDSFDEWVDEFIERVDIHIKSTFDILDSMDLMSKLAEAK